MINLPPKYLSSATRPALWARQRKRKTLRKCLRRDHSGPPPFPLHAHKLTAKLTLPGHVSHPRARWETWRSLMKHVRDHAGFTPLLFTPQTNLSPNKLSRATRLTLRTRQEGSSKGTLNPSRSDGVVKTPSEPVQSYFLGDFSPGASSQPARRSYFFPAATAMFLPGLQFWRRVTREEAAPRSGFTLVPLGLWKPLLVYTVRRVRGEREGE